MNCVICGDNAHVELCKECESLVDDVGYDKMDTVPLVESFRTIRAAINKARDRDAWRDIRRIRHLVSRFLTSLLRDAI